MPIVPFGAGTSLEGHINAPHGGLSLDFSRMNRILAVNERDLDCVVEPGVSRKQLNDYLRDMGLFFPVDPGAEEATIGGMASTRASGTTAVRYGTMRENVLNLTAVMADGSVVKTAQRARKSSAGYDLTRLLVGSEGTLGIITELTVRLYGIPEAILAAVCPFQTLEGACNAVIQSIQLGPRAWRAWSCWTTPQVTAVNIHSKLAPRGEADAVPGVPRHRGRHRATRSRPSRRSPRPRARSASTGPRARRTAAGCGRRATTPTGRSRPPGPAATRFATDVCVPISRLAECVLETQEDIRTLGLIAPIVGHVGDGNFQPTPDGRPQQPQGDGGARELSRPPRQARASPWTAPAPASTASARARCKYLEAEHGAGRRGDARHQGGARSRRHHEPRQDLPGVTPTTEGHPLPSVRAFPGQRLTPH